MENRQLVDRRRTSLRPTQYGRWGFGGQRVLLVRVLPASRDADASTSHSSESRVRFSQGYVVSTRPGNRVR